MRGAEPCRKGWAMGCTKTEYQNCLKILGEELLPAMGCTEPIAVAYCAAVARETLGTVPDKVEVWASGNIIKNVKSVIVPNTGRLRGIAAAAAAGIVAGDASRQLEVISSVSAEKQKEITQFLERVPISVALAESGLIFDIVVCVHSGSSYAKTRIANYHTNLILIEKDGQLLKSLSPQSDGGEALTDRSFLSVSLILDFANTVAIEDVKELLDRQTAYNMAIAEEGLRGDWGANIGSVLLSARPEDLKYRAAAMAAAGSDARMSGCELPVVINSGSGNQGISASVPVIVYGRGIGASQEKIYRALVLSNLIAIHQKTGIGRLSAFCGAINAGVASGCGVAYLEDGSLTAISHTLVNALGIVSGVVCDGAKPSCAGKISTAVLCGFLGFEMYRQNQQLLGGDGIVKKGVENMIKSVGRLGREGMKQTDVEILHIMLEDE